MIEIPIEESNLAFIGSNDDKGIKKAAAETEVHWKDAGKKVGIEVWRVENQRDLKDRPQFGIKPWPLARYGEFYRGTVFYSLQYICMCRAILSFSKIRFIFLLNSFDKRGFIYCPTNGQG
jgi:hypothetical protein